MLVQRSGSLWYNATVISLNETNGTYGVKYEDEDEELDVESARVMQFSG